jgi:nucleoside-diphosphate-sugar epimerase
MSPDAGGAGPAVLVTGATGLVGTEVVDQLRAAGIGEVVRTSRRGSPGDPDLVAWDMASEPAPQRLDRAWDVIVNTAANTRWTMTLEEASAANVASVRRLGSLISGETHLIHVSTAYAVGLRGDVESPDPADFRNAYEWSKAHAERVARESFDRLTIVRPPLIVGRRSDGRAARVAGIYTVMRGATAGTVPAIVADPDAYLDAIPVDDLAALLARLAADPEAGDGAVLTIAAGSGAPRVETAIDIVVEALNRWRGSHGATPLEPPRLVSPESWNRFFLPFIREYLTLRQAKILELLGNFEPYLALADPIRTDLEVDDVVSCLDLSTRYWADANPRVAALAPRPWRRATEGAGVTDA